MEAVSLSEISITCTGLYGVTSYKLILLRIVVPKNAYIMEILIFSMFTLSKNIHIKHKHFIYDVFGYFNRRGMK
jgi:hypothetical protein